MNNDDRVKESVRLAADQGISVLEAPRGELDRLADGLPHQGVILQVPEYEYAHPDDLLERAHKAGEPPLIVVLDHVTDPRNLGAVVRSAAAFGAHGVVTAERRSAGMSAAAWKTSSGAAARVPVARTTNISRQLAAYRKAGLLVVGLDADGDLDLGDVDATGPLALVVGAEGAGLSRLVREGLRCHREHRDGRDHRVAERQRRGRDRAVRPPPLSGLTAGCGPPTAPSGGIWRPAFVRDEGSADTIDR